MELSGPTLPGIDKEASLIEDSSSFNKRNVQNNKYNDSFFAFLFLINVFVIAYLGFSFGARAVGSSPPNVITINSETNQVSQDTSTNGGNARFFVGTFVVLGISSLISLGWVFAMSQLASTLITYTLLSSILISFSCGIWVFALGHMTVGVCLMVLAVVACLFFMMLRSKIAFASANLKVACSAIVEMPATIGGAVVMQFVLILFSVVWCLASMGVATNEAVTTISSSGRTYNLNECATYLYSADTVLGTQTLQCLSGRCTACVCSGNSVVSLGACYTPHVYTTDYLLLLLSLLWTCSVLANVVHCTVAGSISEWWNKEPTAVISSAVVQTSFIRATTQCFGSVCLGSLLTSVLRMTRLLLHIAVTKLRQLNHTTTTTSDSVAVRFAKNVQLLVCSAAEVCLQLLDRMLEYFNFYAFCYVGIYGHSFTAASKAVVHLFRARGWTALINDDIIDIVLCVGQVVVSVVCMLVTYVYAQALRLGYPNTQLLTIFGLISGYLMSMITSKVISSSVASVFICFAEQPEALESGHPAHYYELVAAWQVAHPSLIPSALRYTAVEASQLQQQSSYQPPSFARSPPGAGHTAAGSGQYMRLAVHDDQDEESQPQQQQSSTQHKDNNKTEAAAAVKKPSSFIISGKYAASDAADPSSPSSSPMNKSTTSLSSSSSSVNMSSSNLMFHSVSESAIALGADLVTSFHKFFSSNAS